MVQKKRLPIILENKLENITFGPPVSALMLSQGSALHYCVVFLLPGATSLLAIVLDVDSKPVHCARGRVYVGG